LRPVFGRRPRCIFGDVSVDVALGHASVHTPGVRLPDQNLVTVTLPLRSNLQDLDSFWPESGDPA
jgi:hypothetical protein